MSHWRFPTSKSGVLTCCPCEPEPGICDNCTDQAPQEYDAQIVGLEWNDLTFLCNTGICEALNSTYRVAYSGSGGGVCTWRWDNPNIDPLECDVTYVVFQVFGTLADGFFGIKSNTGGTHEYNFNGIAHGGICNQSFNFVTAQFNPNVAPCKGASINMFVQPA